MDFDRLIPEMRDWNGGDGIDVDGWTSCMGNLRLAVGYSRVFWPDFEEHDGMVFRAGTSPQAVEHWKSRPDATRPGVEAKLNHLHILDLHYNDDQATREQLVYLGRVLREIYECKLKARPVSFAPSARFPDRRFTVLFYEDAEELLDYELTFFQSGHHTDAW